jgi:hypothetical protein
VPGWVERCVESVRGWAVDHELLGEELLDLAPGWVHDAAGDSVLPVTDVARLVLVRDRLAVGHDRVVWLDADVLVWDAADVDVEVDADVAVCAERWVTGAPGGGLQALPYVSNAALACCSAAAAEALLDATLERVRAGDVRARSLGPDLLGPLHRAAAFGELRGVSVLSPHVVRDVPGAWDLLVSSLPWPLGAANLCWSMAHHDDVVDRCVDRLLGDR